MTDDKAICLNIINEIRNTHTYAPCMPFRCSVTDSDCLKLILGLFAFNRIEAMKIFERYFRMNQIGIMDKWRLTWIADTYDHYLEYFDVDISSDDIMRYIREEARAIVNSDKRFRKQIHSIRRGRGKYVRAKAS